MSPDIRIKWLNSEVLIDTFRQARIDMLQQQVSQGGGALAEQIAAGSLNPFSNQVRPPTLAECEAIIKHLQKVNENQAHEVPRSF